MYLYERIVEAVRSVLGANLKAQFKGSDVRERTMIPTGSFTPTIKGMKVNPGTGNDVPENMRNLFVYHSPNVYSLTPKGEALILGTTVEGAIESVQLEQDGYWTPTDEVDERRRTNRELVQRQGQPEFRQQLLEIYEFKCAITGCDAVAALEAAHISSYLGKRSNHLSNGIILRADLHSLYDRALFCIDPVHRVVVLSNELKFSSYAAIDGSAIAVPKEVAYQLNRDALLLRWESFRTNRRAVRNLQ